MHHASDAGSAGDDPLDAYMATHVAPAATAQAGPRHTPQPSPASAGTALRNRRYAALTALLASGHDFFSDAAMEERAPALYHEVLGRHQVGGAPSTGAGGSGGSGAGPLTIMLMSALDRQRNSGARRGSEGDSEYDGGSGSGGVNLDVDAGQASDAAGIGVPHSADGVLVTEAGQRAMLLRLMTERFLRGDEAAHFDYAAVDGEGELDGHAESARDAEERYFDGGEDTSRDHPPP